MWTARIHAMELLNGGMKEKAELLEQAFCLIDECIDLFQNKAHQDDFCRICGLTLLKARNLALGCYSLILDGLGQEAGALARPFIEYTELLTYFYRDPSRTKQALHERLPKAGKIAQLIQSPYRDFRSHLNIHASHSAYSVHSLSHLFDRSTMKFRKVQKIVPKVLERNMADLLAHLLLLIAEAINCLQRFRLRTHNQ